jgi:hypothetical protein
VIRKNTRYNLLVMLWGILVFGATVAVFSGKVAPLVTPSMIPVGGPFSLFVFAGGLLVLGGLVVSQLKKRAWKRAGRRANLTPDGSGFFGNPDLVGTHKGRSVTVRTVKRKTGSSGEGGSNKTTYTIVEADLDEPAADGIVAGLGAEDADTNFGELATQLETTTVNDFQAVTDAPERARDLLDGKTQRALEGPERVDTVLVGDASSVLVDAIPDGEGMLAEKMTDAMKSKIEKEFPGDADTVTVQSKGLLLDASALEEQLDAVATVANEFEATGSTAPESTASA